MAVIHEDLAESLYVPGSLLWAPPGDVARHRAAGQDHVLPHRLLSWGPGWTSGVHLGTK